jgi:hypothetical protein
MVDWRAVFRVWIGGGFMVNRAWRAAMLDFLEREGPYGIV